MNSKIRSITLRNIFLVIVQQLLLITSIVLISLMAIDIIPLNSGIGEEVELSIIGIVLFIIVILIFLLIILIFYVFLMNLFILENLNIVEKYQYKTKNLISTLSIIQMVLAFLPTFIFSLINSIIISLLVRGETKALIKEKTKTSVLVHWDIGLLINKISIWFTDFKSDISTQYAISKERLHRNKTFIKITKFLEIFGSHFNKYSIFYILGAIILIFGFVTNWKVLNSHQLVTLLNTNFYILIISMGMLLVIISGNIDLSVGKLMAFLSILSIIVFKKTDSVFLTIIIILLLGLLIGVIDGILIGYFKIPAFIVTLGGMLIWEGLTLKVTGGKSSIIPGGSNSDFGQFFQGKVPDFNLVFTENKYFWIVAFSIFLIMALISILFAFLGRKNRTKYGLRNEVLWIFVIKQILIAALFIFAGYLIATQNLQLQWYIIYILIIIGLFIFITQNTKFGRAVYATGGNRKAAELSGVNTRRTIFRIFVTISLLSSFAGLMFAGLTTSINSEAGTGNELKVISAVFVGGASVSGGVGTVIGTVVGALIIGIVQTGSLVAQLENSIKFMITGLILISAVGYDVFAKKRKIK